MVFASSCLAPILGCSESCMSSIISKCPDLKHCDRDIHAYLKAPLTFHAYVMQHKYVLTLTGVKNFIHRCNNHMLGMQYYIKRGRHDIKSILADINIRKKNASIAIEEEAKLILKELNTPEVVSESSSPGEGATAASVSNANAKVTTVDFWTGLPAQNSPEYEQAVELYFASDVIINIQSCISEIEQRWRSEDEAVYAFAKKTDTVIGGYCYAAWNPLFGHLMKIGATTRTPAIRLRELSNAGVPEPFQLVASLQCVDPFRMERKIHAHFDPIRKYGKKKEFFTLSWEDVSEYFQSLEIEAMTEYIDEHGFMENLRKRKRTELERARASRRVV